jgi:hypothetical protein
MPCKTYTFCTRCTKQGHASTPHASLLVSIYPDYEIDVQYFYSSYNFDALLDIAEGLKEHLKLIHDCLKASAWRSPAKRPPASAAPPKPWPAQSRPESVQEAS